MTTIKSLEQLARTVRALILLSTTEAGSGHPTSSLSATDLMTALLFGGSFRFHPDQPDYPNNDRLIF
jgi:transketolase